MDIPNAVSKILDSFYDMTDEILEKLKEPSGTATETNNTLKVDGRSLQDVLTVATEDVSAHVVNKNNPHKLTAADIGSMDRDTVDATKKIMDMVAFPVGFFRPHTTTIIEGSATTLFDSENNTSAISGFTYTVKRTYDIVVGGVSDTRKPFTFKLTDYPEFNTNVKTWYLYAVSDGKDITYVVHAVKIPESFTTLLVATVVVDTTAIKSVVTWEAVRIGDRWIQSYGGSKNAQSVVQAFSESNCHYIEGKSQ